MHLNSLSFQTGGTCDLMFDKPQGWLRATWTGYVGMPEAIQGGQNYLQRAGPFRCLYLLNDNLALHGPWFDSLEWLEKVWLPQAERTGLRYVAHVVQADTHTDILSALRPFSFQQAIELQIFDEVAAAEEWLRSCQHPHDPTSSPLSRAA